MIHFLSTLIGWNFWWTNQNSFIVKPLFVLGGHHSPVDLSRLPICGPGFESQVHHLCFVQLKSNFVLYLSLCWEKEENKQKRVCVWHILITVVYLSVCLSVTSISVQITFCVFLFCQRFVLLLPLSILAKWKNQLNKLFSFPYFGRNRQTRVRAEFIPRWRCCGFGPNYTCSNEASTSDHFCVEKLQNLK